MKTETNTALRALATMDKLLDDALSGAQIELDAIDAGLDPTGYNRDTDKPEYVDATALEAAWGAFDDALEAEYASEEYDAQALLDCGLLSISACEV